jgi:uncharacterized membrane protein YkvA (DUF1232 family)
MLASSPPQQKPLLTFVAPSGHAIYLAARDPRTPWYAKALAVAVAGYALSPLDLIPDFVPVLGYLDDLLIVPLGIVAVVRLIPPQVMAESRAAAALCSERRSVELPGSRSRWFRRQASRSSDAWPTHA